MILSYLAAAGIAFASPQASGGALRAELAFEPYTDMSEIYNFYGGQMGRGMPDRSTRYSKQYQAPPMASKPVFYKISIGTRDYVGVKGKSKADLKADDLMWIDWNSDKQFSDNELAKPLPNTSKVRRYSSQYAMFMPTTFEGGIPKAAFVFYSSSNLYVTSAGYMTGVLPVGKGLKVGLVDTDGNGSYGDVQNTSDPEAYEIGDAIYIDWNGNGKFDEQNYTRQSKISDIESLPFSKVMQLSDKAFYTIESDPDGTWLEAKPYDGEWATVTVRGAKAEDLALTGPDGMLLLNNLAGTAKVPAINVSINGLSYVVTDPKGKRWHASVSFYERSTRKPLKLKAGQDNLLRCGAPFKAAIGISSWNKAPQNVAGVQNLSVEIIDAGGNSLGSFYDDKNQNPKPPTIDIKDARGKVVKSLKLSYG